MKATTTATKLWLGFGTLTAMLVVSCIIVLVQVRSIEGEVAAMASARDLGAATRKLQVNTLDYALEVRTCLLTDAPKPRQDALEDVKRVEHGLSEYERLATTDTQRQFAARFAASWQEVKTLGITLMDARVAGLPINGDINASLYDHRLVLETLLEDEMQVDAARIYDDRRIQAQVGVKTIAYLILILLVVGVLVASLTNAVVGRAVVRTETEIRSGGEWLRVTLSSIGDGVITTDAQGRVTFLNPVAQALTGWTQEEATQGEGGAGVAIDRVFNIVNEATRAKVENPVMRALRDGVIVGLANHTVLIARNGAEIPIDDSGAPIRRASGETAGAVLVFRDVTEHKRQEKLVNDAFDYASNILDTQREPFLVLDKDLRVVSANTSFYNAFRVEKEATEGRLVYQLGDGQWNIPKLRELLEEVLPQKNTFNGFEVEHDFPGGVGQKTMMINARRIRKPGDDAELILLAIEDVTERKRQEKLAKDAFDYASNILDTQREPFLVLDKDLRVVSANSSFYRAFHVESETTEGRLVYQLGDGQWDIPRLRELLEEVLPKNNAFEGFEVEHDFPGGVGQKTMLLNVRRIDRPGNGSELILVAIEDITERKQAQQAQHDSEVRFRRLFETAKDGILILDANTRKITDANAFMCGLTGIEAGDFLGKELHEIGMYKDVEENKGAFRELQRTGYLRHDHLPVHNRRGEKVEVEFIANIYHEGDKLVAQCNIRDISERSRLEKEVAVQTEALAGQARAKDEFLAMLSHELRNPLAPIRAAVHVLRLQEGGNGTGGNPIRQQAREIIERQVANLTKMVSDLSEVSRVVSGRIKLDLQSVDLKQVVEHALQTAAPLFEQRKHSVSVNLCADSVWTRADPTRLEEILVNLLNNAAKYTPDGGRIEVVCEHHREGGRNHALVRVRDNGVGIDKELLPRIFDLFTQADRSLARSEGGLGIGLSLAQRLVALHGGIIWAHSPGEGKGSEFTVRLPLIPEPLATPAADEPAPIVQTPGPAGTGAGGGAVRVLVVDDNVDLVTMLCGALRHKGFSVQSAYTGPEGLRIAQQWQPDIALLDIGLPGLDGYEIARRLRADHVVRVAAADDDGDGIAVLRMKLIAITGYGKESDIALAREAGFDGHMHKPCDFNELEKMMAAPAFRM